MGELPLCCQQDVVQADNLLNADLKDKDRVDWWLDSPAAVQSSLGLELCCSAQRS